MSVRILNGAESTFYDFDLSYQNGNIAGRLSWDQDNATAQIGLNQNVVARVSQDDMWYVKNQTGASIPKGTVVSAVGTVGASGRILVAPSVGNGSVPAKFILGIAAETIADGADGYVISKGKLRSIDTSLYSAGDVLWLNPSVNGGLTATEPQAPNLKISIAFVVHSSVSAGVLAVRTDSGNDLYDDSRVQMIGTPSTGQLLRYNANRWENWSPNFVTTSRTINIAGTANQVTVVGGTQDLSANRTWTLSLPQNIHTGASPTFAGLNLNGNAQLISLQSTGSPYIRVNMGGNATTGTYQINTWGSSRLLSIETMGDSQIVIDENNNMTDKAFIVRHNGTTGPQLFRVQEDGFSAFGDITPTQRLDINGNIRVRSLTTLAGDFVTADANGVFSRRTAAQTLTDIGAQAALTNPVTGTGAAGRVAFWTGTTTQSSDAGFFWDNTNKRLGIGTSGPSDRLHVNLGTLIVSDSNQTTSQVNIGVGILTSGRPFLGTNTNTNPLEIGTRAAVDAIFVTNSTEKMRITSGGNVGIRTTTPSSILDANTSGDNNSFITVRQSGFGTNASPLLSGILFRATSNNHAKGLIASENRQFNTWSSDMVFYTINATAGAVTDLAERMRLLGDATGSSPVLQFNGASTIRTSTGNLTLATNGGSGNIILSPNGSGNVGIGTTTPNERLTVIGNISVGFGGGTKIGYSVHDAFTAFSSSAAQYGMSFSGSATPVVLSGYYGVGIFTNSTERIRVSQTGNVGIGTTAPTHRLHITGPDNTINFIVSNGTQGFYVQNSGINVEFYSSGAASGGYIFRTGNTERMRITSGGNVGIGTTNPIEKFQVYEGGNTALKTYSSTGTGVILTSYQSEFSPFTKTTDLVAGSDGTTPSQIRFFTRTNGSASIDERIRITSTGNVGIGTTSPSAKLDIVGGGSSSSPTLELNTTTSVAFNHAINAFNSNLTAGENQIIVFGKEGSNKNSGYIGYTWNGEASNSNVVTIGHWGIDNLVNINALGNVGIGTTTPSAKLDIQGEHVASIGLLRLNSNLGNLSAQTFYINNVYKAAVFVNLSNDFNIWGREANTIFSTGASITERMRITSGGNVGIGTTSPSQKLDVVGIRAVSLDTTGGNILFRMLPAEPWTMGNKFVGSSGTEYGGWRAFGSSNTLNYHFLGDSQLTPLMVVLPSGRVGIGTTTPDNKLHIVSGTAGEVAQFTGAVANRGLSIRSETNVDASAWVVFNSQSGGSQGMFSFETDGTERWRMLNSGILQSNGAQTIRTSTGALTLATNGGNGSVFISPNGTGIFQVSKFTSIDIYQTPQNTLKLRNRHTNNVNSYDLNLFPTTINYDVPTGTTSTNLVISTSVSGTGAFSAGFGNIVLQPIAGRHVTYAAPSGSNETAALFLTADQNIVKRTLGTGAFATIADYLTVSTAASTYALRTLTLTAGDGLTGGGDLTANRTFTLGTPSTLTATSANALTATSHTHAITTTETGASSTIVQTSGAGRIRAAGFSTSYGVTDGISTGAFNAIMGTSTSATWLLSGTSNGTFRAGIQVLDAGGTMRFYVGANFFSFTGNTLTANTFVADSNFVGALSGNATTATTLATARTINGTSFNGSSNINITEWLHSQRDFADGTIITTDINYGVTNGDPWILEIKGNSYGAQPPFGIQVQGYIYNNTIINHGGYSVGTNISGMVVLNVSGNLVFWFPRQSYWQGFNVKVYTAQSGRPTNRVTSITNGVKPTGTKEVALSANIRQAVHTTRTLAFGTNNGITGGVSALDLSANRSWTFGLTGQALALHNLASNGIIVRTGAGTVAARTLVAGTGVTITNADGVAGNITINATGTGGTVTSVGLAAPTGFSVSGSPVTAAGTLTLGFAAGYSLPTTASQTNWNTAFGWGNHASAGYGTSTADITGVALNTSNLTLIRADGNIGVAIPTWNQDTIGRARFLEATDTRTVNDQPQGKIARRLGFDFKTNANAGSPPVTANSLYSHILTVAAWNTSEGSGGWPTQLSIGTQGIAFRQATNATTWGGWQRMWHSGDFTATNVSNWDTAYGWGDHSLGGYLTGNQTITLSGDVTGSGATAITTTIANNAVTTAKIADRAVTLGKLPQPSSYSVLGNAAGFTPSNYADIVAGANSILRRDGTGNLTFGSLQTAMIADAAVTFAKISSGSALSVLGRSANSTGVMASIAAGTDGHVLRRSGTTLGFGTIGNASISGLAWSKIISTPTTLAGYGITDALFGINQVQGRVAFWSGVENQVSGSGSFFWDNTNIRLGIGTAAPVGSLDVSRFNTQNDIYFHNGTTYNTTTNVALYFGTANYSAVNNGTTFRYKWWMDGIATGKDLVLSRQQFNGSTVVNTESFRLTSSGAASFAGSLTIGSIANGTGSFLTHSSGLVRSRTAAQVLADLGIQNNVVPDDIVCMTLTANETFTTGDLVIPYDSAYTDPTTRYETGGYISVSEGEEWTFTVRTTVTSGTTPVDAFTVQIFGADSDKVAVEPYGANINMGTISGTTVVVNVSCIVKIPSGTDFVGVRILNTQSQSRTITSGRHLNGFEGKRIK